MSASKTVAASLIETAGTIVTEDRPNVHGATEESFRMIAELWSVYLSHTNSNKVQVQPKDVAQMMSMLKKCRSVYGDPDNRDNFVDDIGYTALAGMLQISE